MSKLVRFGWSILPILALAFGWSGCRHDDPVAGERNKPPETYLVSSPRQGDAGNYVNYLFWEGFDPDGRVEYFEIGTADSFATAADVLWRKTFRTDSLVRFDVGGESGRDQLIGNKFFVRAVDNDGRPDPEPAWLFFDARDAAFPEIAFTTAVGWNPEWPDPGNPRYIALRPSDRCDFGFPADTLPIHANVEFRWRGVDRDSLFGREIGFVTQYEHKLSGVDNLFLGGSIADTSATYTGLAEGTYTFTVRAVDDGGLRGEGCRYFQVNFDPWARINKVFSSCSGDSVNAYGVATQWDTQDPCLGSVFAPWDYAAQGLPDPVENACTPAGALTSGDTLGIGNDPAIGWWISFGATFGDPDGEVAAVEVNRMECRRGFCSARPWKCASMDSVGAGRVVYVGPFTSGDYRVVIAAVDTTGQRGTAGADTVDVHVDRAPVFVTRTVADGLLPMAGCDRLTGDVGDTVWVCDNDTLYVVQRTQSRDATAPCAYSTEYADNGETSPVTVSNRESFPQDGEVVELEFFDAVVQGVPVRVANLYPLLWGKDLDARGTVGYVRWALDHAVPPTTAWETVTVPPSGTNPIDPSGLTPICFATRVVGDGEHTLYVEIRDWGVQDVMQSPPVAERVGKQQIRFTAVDVSKGRFKLPGRIGS